MSNGSVWDNVDCTVGFAAGLGGSLSPGDVVEIRRRPADGKFNVKFGSSPNVRVYDLDLTSNDLLFRDIQSVNALLVSRISMPLPQVIVGWQDRHGNVAPDSAGVWGGVG